jgi:hypothetical protein
MLQSNPKARGEIALIMLALEGDRLPLDLLNGKTRSRRDRCFCD